MSKIKKNRMILIYISIFVIISLLGIFMVFRSRGVPVCMDRGCGGKFGLCSLMANLFPDRCVYKYNNGNPKQIEVTRGIKPCTSVWNRYDDCSLVSGYYYSPSGKLVSTVKNGNGVALLHYENGKIRSKTVYKNGKYKNRTSYDKKGSISCIYSSGTLRYSDGLTIKYYPDRQKESQGVFKNNKRYGIHKKWHANGQLKEQIQYDKNGVKVSEEHFDINGKNILPNTKLKK